MRHRLIDQLLEAELPEGGTVFGRGTVVPADNATGYAKGCIFIKTDGTNQTNTMYCNIGTAALANFNLVTVAADA